MWPAATPRPTFIVPIRVTAVFKRREFQANSIYNSLQASARRTVGHLQLSVAYTWSHSIDDSSDGGDGNFVNSYNLRGTRSSSNFDQRHLFNLSYVYDLPFFTKPGLVHTLLGAWQWSGLVTYQSGTPFSVMNGAIGDNAGVGNGVGTGSYVDMVGDPYATPTQKQTTGVLGPVLYNPAAFAEPTGLTFGTPGETSLTIQGGPTSTWVCSNVFRSEAKAVHSNSAAEGFNVFNHTQWNGVLDGTPGASRMISGMEKGPRFGVRPMRGPFWGRCVIAGGCTPQQTRSDNLSPGESAGEQQ